MAKVINGTAGNDVLMGGHATEEIYGFDGNDKMWGSYNRDLLDGGNGNDRLWGGDWEDQLFGGAGNDVLNGGADADEMAGGIGNDTYYVDNVGDTVTEYDGEGVDLVRTTIDYTLGANVEKLVLLPGAINGTGNELDNAIKGNSADNVLSGLAGKDQLTGANGNDQLVGGADNDRLSGGAGNDVLTGGLGRDVLTGGADNDTFVFNQGDSLVASRDVVRDFTQGEDLLNVNGADWSYVDHGTSTTLFLDYGTSVDQVQLVGSIHFTASDFLS